MRHGNKNKHLGRTMEHRQAMFANMSNSLIEHKRIETTIQKAKALRKYFEPLVTRARENTTHSRRIVFGHLQSKEAIKELFGPIAEAVGDRPGGYVRIIRTGFRHGDAAEMALIELVDYNPDYNGQAKAGDTSKGKKRRTRRGGGAAKAATTAAVAAAPVVIAEVAEEDMIAVGEIAEEAAEAAESSATEAAENDTEAPAKDEE